MPAVRRGYRLLHQSVLGLSVLLLFQLAFAGTVAAGDLVLGYVPGLCGLIQTREQADALASYLGDRLGQPVRVRVFKSEKNLHLWLNRFREVDFAVFSRDYLEHEAKGAFIPLAGYIRKSLNCDGSGRIVARRGVPAFLFVAAGNALAGLRNQVLLDRLDVLRFYRAGERPAGLANAPSGRGAPPDNPEASGHMTALRSGPAATSVVSVRADLEKTPSRVAARPAVPKPQKPVLELLSPKPGGRTGPNPLLQFHLRYARARILLDGKPLKAGPGDRLGPLADGRHELIFELSAASETSVRTFQFEVDATPPQIEMERTILAALQQDISVQGRTEPGALVRLLDPDGREVATGEANDSGHWQLRVPGLKWGRNDFQVVARDVYGNQSRVGLAVVRVKEKPEVAILSPKQGAVLSQVPTLAYTAAPGTAEILIDGRKTGDPTETLRSLSDGQHSVEVRLRTEWGETLAQTVTFVLDRQGPELVVASPVDGRAYNQEPVVEWQAATGSVVVELDGEVADVANGGRLPDMEDGEHQLIFRATDEAGNETVRQIRFLLDRQGPAVQLLAPAAKVKEASPVVAWQTDGVGVRVFLDGSEISATSGQPLPQLADGTHTLKLQASDAAGNIQSVEHVFEVDATPPTFDIDPVQGIVGPSGLTLSGHREPGSFIDVLVVPQAQTGEVAYPDGTSWTVALNNLQQGENLAVVIARDAFGNEARREVRFQVDVTAPKIRIVAPPAGALADSRPALKIDADEGSVRVFLDGELLEPVPERLGPLADGEHVLLVEAVDAAGNHSRVERRFVVDTRPPEVAIFSPADGDRTGPDPVIDYKVVDGRGRLLLDGRPVEVEPGEQLLGLADGDHRLRLEAIDTVGNLAVSEVRFSVDSSVPKVVLTEPAAGVTFDPTPPLKYSIDRGQVRVYVDGRPVDKVSGDSLGPLAPGEHSVRVEAVDETGNVGRAERRFVVARPEPPAAAESAGPRLERFSAKLNRRVIAAGSDRPLVLQLGPLHAPGETVHIEQWLDANGNGVADTGEQVVQTFRLVDGIPPAPGVPGDADGVADRQMRVEFPLDSLRSPGVPGKRFVLLIMTEHNLAEIGFRFADGG